MINGERIKITRELRGLTQTELAKKTGVTQPTIAQIENGSLLPKEDVLRRISFTTGFPMDFFKLPKCQEFPLGSLLFRARTSITLREKYEASQYGRVLYEIFHNMEYKVDSIPLRLPRLTEDPVTSAKLTRSQMGISPDSPIKNLVNLIEKVGVTVLALPKSLKKRDAYSLWVGGKNSRAVIVLSGGNPGDRVRFSIAHELAHLVLHDTSLTGDVKKLESEANQFAGEFLFPSKAAFEEIIPPVTLISLVPLKLRWGLSLQALIRRSYDLEIISERQYKYLNQQISQRGWKTSEPSNLDIPIEKPRALRKMAELIYSNPIDFKAFSSDMKISPKFLKDIMECYSGSPTIAQQQNNNRFSSTKILNFKKPNS